MGFITALRFLTILPVPFYKHEGTDNLGRTLAYFPVIGAILGAILVVLNYFFSLILPSSIVAVLLIIALVILTGAHHIDGLIDTCDALVAGKTYQERQAIMSDTRVGAFGITGICLLLLLKYVALSQVISLATLLVMPAISRWGMSYAIMAFPSAKNSGMGYAIKSQANRSGLIASTIITIFIAMIFTGLVKGLMLCAAALILMYCMAAVLNHKFHGLTGDNYGAVNEAGEALTLILIAIISRIALPVADINIIR